VVLVFCVNWDWSLSSLISAQPKALTILIKKFFMKKFYIKSLIDSIDKYYIKAIFRYFLLTKINCTIIIFLMSVIR